MMLGFWRIIESGVFTLWASSRAIIRPPSLRPSMKSDRQMEKRAHASFSLTKGQLKSMIVSEPFSKFQTSVFLGLDGAPGLGISSMKASRSCSRNFRGMDWSALNPAAASRRLKSLYFKPGAPLLSIAMSRRTWQRTWEY